jgi:hypothetical protein
MRKNVHNNGKAKGNAITGHEEQKGSTGVALLFL